MEDLSKPLMLYDGDCGFCRRWVARWRIWTEGRVDYAPWQEAGERFPDIPRENFRKAVQLIEPGGRVFEGACAVFRALGAAPGKRWTLWLYENLPGFAPASEFCYRIVADHRTFFSRLTRIFER